MKQRRLRQTLKQKARHQHHQRQYNLHERPLQSRRLTSKLSREDLDAVLEVDPGDEEAEGVAGKPSDIFKEVAPYGVSAKRMALER